MSTYAGTRTRPLRVVHISKVTGIAGSERHLLTLLPRLNAAGLDPHMIVLESRAGVASRFERGLVASGIPVQRTPIAADVDLGLTGRLTRQLRDLAPDIVHTHLLHADVYGLRAAHELGLPTVSSRHNTDRFRRRAWVRLLNRRTMRHVHRVIAISQAVAEFVVAVEGCDPGRVVTIPYGFAMPSGSLGRVESRLGLGYADADQLVGVVARLTAQKGVDVLIDAFAALSTTHPRLHLLVVGDGPDRTWLERRAAAAGVGARVRFTGWLDDSSAVLAACDVMVVPSRWEGFCLAAVEAMAAGRPLVASDVDALREVVVDGETGILVPPDDVAALARSIGALLADPARAARLGAAGQARAARAFPVDTMVEQTIGVYEAIDKAR